MNQYRMIQIRRDGKTFSYHDLLCRDDVDAIVEAGRLLMGYTVEVWEKQRLVVRIDPQHSMGSPDFRAVP